MHSCIAFVTALCSTSSARIPTLRYQAFGNRGQTMLKIFSIVIQATRLTQIRIVTSGRRSEAMKRKWYRKSVSCHSMKCKACSCHVSRRNFIILSEHVPDNPASAERDECTIASSVLSPQNEHSHQIRHPRFLDL